MIISALVAAMFHSSIIQQMAIEDGINLENLANEDKLPIYRRALDDIEEKLDSPDKSTITENDINILVQDLSQIIKTLRNLRKSIRELYQFIKFGETRAKLIDNSLRSLGEVRLKIRYALTELYIASDMLDVRDSRSFLNCLSNFQDCLSQGSSAFIPMQILVKELNLSYSAIQVNSGSIDEKSRQLLSRTTQQDPLTTVNKGTERSDRIISPVKHIVYDTEVIRNLLLTSFDDISLTELCFDHFREVYNKFATGMDKRQKIQFLIEHIFQKSQVENLLIQIQRKSPEKYTEYEDRLVK